MVSVSVAFSEETSWGDIFAGLLDRGLDPGSVRYVVADEHRGLRAALQRYLPGAIMQRYPIHYQRNAGSNVFRRVRWEVHTQLKNVFNAPGLKQARDCIQSLVKRWGARFPKLAEWIADTIEEPFGVFALPPEHRKRLRTTNGLDGDSSE